METKRKAIRNIQRFVMGEKSKRYSHPCRKEEGSAKKKVFDGEKGGFDTFEKEKRETGSAPSSKRGNLRERPEKARRGGKGMHFVAD